MVVNGQLFSYVRYSRRSVCLRFLLLAIEIDSDSSIESYKKTLLISVVTYLGRNVWVYLTCQFDH